MSDRYLKILPYVVTFDAKYSKITLQIFIVMCDMADEDGYVVNPEKFISELGISTKTTTIRSALKRLQDLGWIKQVEHVAGYFIWRIMLEPHQSANVKKFIVTDGTIEVTIKSTGLNDFLSEITEHNVTTFNKLNWPTKKNNS